jgi:hypothetical protein
MTNDVISESAPSLTLKSVLSACGGKAGVEVKRRYIRPAVDIARPPSSILIEIRNDACT